MNEHASAPAAASLPSLLTPTCSVEISTVSSYTIPPEPGVPLPHLSRIGHSGGQPSRGLRAAPSAAGEGDLVHFSLTPSDSILRPPVLASLYNGIWGGAPCRCNSPPISEISRLCRKLTATFPRPSPPSSPPTSHPIADFWWCALSGFATICSCISLSFSVILISYCMLSMLRGVGLPDKLIRYWSILGWREWSTPFWEGFGSRNLFRHRDFYRPGGPAHTCYKSGRSPLEL